MSRRPARISIDPAWFEYHGIGGQTAVEDTYFDPGEQVDTLEKVIGLVVDRLPEPDRTCVRVTVMHRHSYEHAAGYLEVDLGYRPDRKTVWRWTQRGLDQIKDELQSSPWANVLLDGRIPPG